MGSEWDCGHDGILEASELVPRGMMEWMKGSGKDAESLVLRMMTGSEHGLVGIDVAGIAALARIVEPKVWGCDL